MPRGHFYYVNSGLLLLWEIFLGYRIKYLLFHCLEFLLHGIQLDIYWIFFACFPFLNDFCLRHFTFFILFSFMWLFSYFSLMHPLSVYLNLFFLSHLVLWILIFNNFFSYRILISCPFKFSLYCLISKELLSFLKIHFSKKLCLFKAISGNLFFLKSFSCTMCSDLI